MSWVFSMINFLLSDKSLRIIENIAFLCSQRHSGAWGFDSWQKVVICIIADGRSKINDRTLQVLTLVGLG